MFLGYIIKVTTELGCMVQEMQDRQVLSTKTRVPSLSYNSHLICSNKKQKQTQIQKLTEENQDEP